jgi:hypothetical protein
MNCIMMLWDWILFTYALYDSIFKSFVKIFVKNHCCQSEGAIPITNSFSKYTLLAILGCEYISYYMHYKAI